MLGLGLLSVAERPQSLGAEFPGFGFSVAATAERDDVLEEVRIRSGDPVRFDVPPNRDEVMGVRIAAFAPRPCFGTRDPNLPKSGSWVPCSTFRVVTLALPSESFSHASSGTY